MVAGIGAIQNDQFFSIVCTGFHNVIHRTDIGVESRSYILYVEYQDVDVLHLSYGRFLIIPIE